MGRAMRAAINCALANRQIFTQLVRGVFARVLHRAQLSLLYGVSHNTCKVEAHVIDGKTRMLYVYRKGATRAFGPGHPDVLPALRTTGQPVLIDGTMGTASYVLAGTAAGEEHSYSSACHGTGRAMSRHQARETWHGRQVIDELAARGILIRIRRGAGWPRRHRVPARMLAWSWMLPMPPGWHARWRGWSRWSASRARSLPGHDEPAGKAASPPAIPSRRDTRDPEGS